MKHNALPGAPAELFPGWVKGNFDRPGWVKIKEFSCLGGSKPKIFPVCMVKLRKFAKPGGSSDPV